MKIDGLADLYNTKSITCPPQEWVLRATSLCPPNMAKIVILGQDPYHSVDRKGNCKANGLAFGINPDWEGPRYSGSMKSIVDELHAQPELFDYSLESWARQGVLLLNTTLTVKEGFPMSHTRAWQGFAMQVLEKLPPSAIVLCWGKEALSVGSLLPLSHPIIYTSHPIPYSASRGPNPFRGSDCFEEVNKLLVEQGKLPIIWAEKGQ